MPTSAQVSELGSQSPGALIELGNFVHTTTGGYMEITGGLDEFTFRKELHQGNHYKKYHQVRSGICVDDVKLPGKSSSKVRVYKQGTAEPDRVKRDMLTAHKKWTFDRASAALRVAAEDAVVFRSKTSLRLPPRVTCRRHLLPWTRVTRRDRHVPRKVPMGHGLGTSYCPISCRIR